MDVIPFPIASIPQDALLIVDRDERPQKIIIPSEIVNPYVHHFEYWQADIMPRFPASSSKESQKPSELYTTKTMSEIVHSSPAQAFAQHLAIINSRGLDEVVISTPLPQDFFMIDLKKLANQINRKLKKPKDFREKHMDAGFMDALQYCHTHPIELLHYMNLRHMIPSRSAQQLCYCF